jgi:hypothetical protein
MGNSAGQGANRLHLLGMPQLVFKPLPIIDVPADPGGSDGAFM